MKKRHLGKQIKIVAISAAFLMLTSCGAKEDAEVSVSEVQEEADEAYELEDYRVFASEKMEFSFLYDSAHTAYVTETGAAELAINGDDSLVGLFVSVVPADNMPAPKEIMEEEIFNLQQKYQNAMTQQPEMETTDIEGHEVTILTYAYSDQNGNTVECSEFIEVRDENYIFYESAAYSEESGPELTAVGVAMGTLEFSADAYGESDAIEGEIDQDTTPVSTEEQNDEDWGRGDSAPIGIDSLEKQSGFTFDVDSSFLVIADEGAAMIYTGGTMEGSYFAVEEVSLSVGIGDMVVQRKNEVLDYLQNRIATPPEVVMLEIGDRRIAGIEYAYSAIDGSKTLEGVEYYEQIGDQVYNWYAFYDRGDTITMPALEKAMETFTVK